MDPIISKIIDNITTFKFLSILYIVFMNIVVAGNVIELYGFLLTIPILEWLLNYQILIVVRQIIITFIVLNLMSFVSGVLAINFGKDREIDKDVKTIEEIFNNALILSTLVFIIIIILIVTKSIEISIFVRFLGVGISLILFYIYGYTFNKFVDFYKTNEQKVWK